MAMANDGDKLTRFFAGGADDDGRTFDEILGWDDARLEMVHDYIQWIFPLPERSGANPWAPVLDAATIAAIRNDAEMQERLRAGFQRMLAFYGFDLEGDAVVQGPRFVAASRNWLHAGKSRPSTVDADAAFAARPGAGARGDGVVGGAACVV